MTPMRLVGVHRWMIALVVAAMLSLPIAAFVVGRKVNTNCKSVHTLYVALDGILADNNTRIDRAVREGTLTPKQGFESHVFNERARASLRKGDCQ